jgi:hypothetical protein
VCHAFDRLEENSAHCLEDGQQIYGLGMWAPSLRWHDGTFYLTFSCNDTHASLLFQAENPAGPWRRLEMGGFFYDASLFFDDDGRVYIVHGNTELCVTELDKDTWGPKPGSSSPTSPASSLGTRGPICTGAAGGTICLPAICPGTANSSRQRTAFWRTACPAPGGERISWTTTWVTGIPV